MEMTHLFVGETFVLKVRGSVLVGVTCNSETLVETLPTWAFAAANKSESVANGDKNFMSASE